jgi:hypothetical protein
MLPDNKPMTPEEFAEQLWLWIKDGPKKLMPTVLIELKTAISSRDESIRREAKREEREQFVKFCIYRGQKEMADIVRVLPIDMPPKEKTDAR